MAGRPQLPVPGLAALVALALLAAVAERGLDAGLPLSAVNAAALAYWAVVLAAPLVVHPWAFRRGHGGAARVASSLLPFAGFWLSQVALRLAGHPLPEALFLTFALPNVLHLQLLALEIVAAELACRAVARRRGRPVRILARGPAVAAAAVLLWIASGVLWVLPYYGAFQATYYGLFGTGHPKAPERAPLPAPGPRAPAAGGLPNIVVILSDDHRADFAGHAGHPFVETPSLDRLAAEGVRFANAFVPTSLCSPSRASFLTGLHAPRHGVLDNATPWDDRNRTFFEYLKPLGYRTAFVGKWHMPGGLPELRGVDHFVTFTALGGQGMYFDTPLVVDGEPEPSRRSYIAEELTDRALLWLEENAEGPFVLFLSHKNVHGPFRPAPQEAGRYAEREVPLPPGAPHSLVPVDDAQYVHFVFDSVEDQVRRYAEAVASMDREIGRLLARLGALGVLDRTLVIYTSDNGYLWGERGLIDKRWAYEPSIRIPFLLRYPPLQGEAGRAQGALLLNVDLAPTLLDLAGVPVPEAMQGRSLLPLLRDPQAPWREAFRYDYVFEPPFPVPTQRALRTARHKWIEFEGGRPPELYDLARDPRERESLAGDPDTAALRRDLARRLRELRPAG